MSWCGHIDYTSPKYPTSYSRDRKIPMSGQDVDRKGLDGTTLYLKQQSLGAILSFDAPTNLSRPFYDWRIVLCPVPYTPVSASQRLMFPRTGCFHCECGGQYERRLPFVFPTVDLNISLNIKAGKVARLKTKAVGPMGIL